MIELAKVETQINAPVNVVYSYMTNMENYGNWFPGVVDIKSVDKQDHLAIGKRYQEALIIAGQNVALNIEVVEAERNKAFITQGDLAGLLPQMTMTFEQNNTNCTVRLQYHSRNLDFAANDDLSHIQADLTSRATTAMENLNHIFTTDVD
ncbi:SRPBCC family protein [Catenovulum sp. SM1970]|uniref:SRPBCC family protein n=1 Tax=Marinifaba aquimaris TaxID=2741323 RepID=UPI001571F2E1|nr:SRPBCC family protein [Marinifaba aquimaris]NTS77038.1 SRPBCC family protein [Marinifaba aquimaris]